VPGKEREIVKGVLGKERELEKGTVPEPDTKER